MAAGSLDGQFALDMQGVQRLRHTASRDADAGLREAAQQFEAIFVQMMLKSMRDAVPQSGLLDSQETQFYNSMMDQQWSQQVAAKGIGLADQMIRQLEGKANPRLPEREDLFAGIPRGVPKAISGQRLIDELPSLATGGAAARAAPAHVRDFLAHMQVPARVASAHSGIPAELMLAQAALETGWGRYRILAEDGTDSHNFFGIKAGSNWRGPTTEITTHEYQDGRATRMTDRFRVYSSVQHAFSDYASLIRDNPRYEQVITATDVRQAAQALQAAGYATDPAYADKLISVVELARSAGGAG